MTSSSLWGHIVELGGGISSQGQPFDTLTTRAMVNNANHLADGAGQVKVCHASESGNGIDRSGQFGEADVWKLMWKGPSFGFRIQADGTPYALRVRMAGYETQAGTGDRKLRLRIRGRFGTLATKDFTIGGLSAAWLSPDSGGNVVSLSSEDAIEVEREVSTIDGVGGNPVTIAWPRVRCDVLGLTQDTGSRPVFAGLYIAEYAG